MLLLYSGGTSASTEAVDNVMLLIGGIGVALLAIVTVAMIYFVFKYHRKKGHKPVDIHGSAWVEALFIGVPTILVLIMFYYGYEGFRNIRNIPENAMEIEVTGRMWAWTFEYDNGKTTDTLYVPKDQPIKLNMTSQDVNHSLYIPAFRIKEDVIPSRENYLSFTADKTGRYKIACAEYCGLNHSQMYTDLVVMEPNRFESWLESKPDTAVKADTASVAEKKAKQDVSQSTFHKGDVDLLHKKGCTTCHSLDGSKKQAPTFKQIYGRQTTVVTSKGEEKNIVIDTNYLKKAILEPNIETVAGYPTGLMPKQKSNLTKSEVNQIVSTLKGFN
jgi:cytochrome c oxidase subunit 2